MSTTGYRPFPITEQKTGMFDYTQAWIRPQDAWEPLENAFIYRGVLNKRDGYIEFGRMAYRDNGTALVLGDGGAAYSDASVGAITLPTLPIRPGSLIIVAQSAAGPLLTATDNGAGQFIGDVVAPPSGAIDYALGTWSLTFNANVLAGSSIRAGYTFVPSQTTLPAPITNRPIMGLKTWTNEATDNVLFLALDTRRAAVYNAGASRFDPISGVSQVVWVGDGATVNPITTSGWIGIAPFSVTVTDGATTIRDNGLGVMVQINGAALPVGNFNAGTVNYATGVVNLTFAVAPVANANITANFLLTGDYFTGDYTGFFNATNWNTYLYLTNNTDRITRFNGATLDRPPFAITLAHYQTLVNDITTCLDIDVYKNRLLVQRPTTNTVLEPQSIRFSATNNPLNLAADVTGNGGELSAPTDDFLQASEFLRDQLIVFFTNTTFIFRFTGSPFEPFRFDKLNITKSCNSPYGTVAYDDRVTAMGKKGLVYCDGTNVARYDNAIIDQYLDINQTDFDLCYGLRHDIYNQTFMLYPSAGQDSSNQKTVLSDKILVYNYLENTWATYLLPMSCLGLFRTTGDAVWNDFAPGGKYYLVGYTSWSLCDFSWNFWFTQSDALSVMGGGHDGIIWQMNIGEFDRDPPGFTIDVNCTSTRWNPFIKEGQKAQFGWLDVYYQKDDDTHLTLTFYTDNSSAPAVTKTCQLDGPANVDAAFKRIYLNITGEFLQMNITSANSGFSINGFILWAKPAGRLIP